MYPINASALIRTVRFAARYGFDIDAATTTAIKDNMHYCKETITGPMNNYYICKGFGDGYAQHLVCLLLADRHSSQPGGSRKAQGESILLPRRAAARSL